MTYKGGSRNFSKGGGGGEEENFERIMFDDTRINACTHKNKRPMGHIAHLRKQFNSISIYDYIITLIKRRKKP